MAPVDAARQIKRILFQRPLIDERGNLVEAMLRQRPAVLRDRIYLQRHAIEQVVIVEAAQVDVALHQLMLRQITQHPFQQATGGGEQRFGGRPSCAHS